jgi:hypothetical protein
MRRHIRPLGVLALCVTAANAWAQPTVTDGASASSGAGASSPGTGGASAPSQVTIYPGVPYSAGTATSSGATGSRPMVTDHSPRDAFELNASDSANTVRGSKGSFAITGQSPRALHVPEIHTVRQGDTLWDLCGHYLGSSWEWPRIWSYNPDIRNPNWIYPGDQVRMRSLAESGGPGEGSLLTGDRGQAGRSLTGGAGSSWGQGQRVPRDTVFLRNEAYIEDPKKDVLGEVIGAKEEQTLLGQGNHVYLDIKPGSQLQVGQELTLFDQSRKPEPVEGARQPPGEIIVVKGTVQIQQFDDKKNIAKARIVESVDAIERGTKVGLVGRRYLAVPPAPSKVTVWARLLTGIYPHVFLGQHQLVFIDRGSEDGLVPGNRLLVVRRGDTWRRSLDTGSKSARLRMRVDLPGKAETESTQIKRDDGEFPQEIVGELRIVNAHRWTSLAIVSATQRELFPGDRAVARDGF